jgi:hypothetical protein
MESSNVRVMIQAKRTKSMTMGDLLSGLEPGNVRVMILTKHMAMGTLPLAVVYHAHKDYMYQPLFRRKSVL